MVGCSYLLSTPNPQEWASLTPLLSASFSAYATAQLELHQWLDAPSEQQQKKKKKKSRAHVCVWSGKCVISEVWELEVTTAIICSDILYYRKRSGRHRPLLRRCCPEQLLLELEQTARDCFFLKAWPKPLKHSRSLLVAIGVCWVVAEINGKHAEVCIYTCEYALVHFSPKC